MMLRILEFEFIQLMNHINNQNINTPSTDDDTFTNTNTPNLNYHSTYFLLVTNVIQHEHE